MAEQEEGEMRLSRDCRLGTTLRAGTTSHDAAVESRPELTCGARLSRHECQADAK